MLQSATKRVDLRIVNIQIVCIERVKKSGEMGSVETNSCNDIKNGMNT